MQLLIHVVFFCITAYISCYGQTFNDYVFTQQWPTSFCSGDRCSFAKNITGWTIHGLWPSVNESYPNNCNSTWKLHPTDIIDLEDDMRAQWPSFGGTDWEFWRHEWEKHGTCAASVPGLRGPHNFFKYALMLNKKYNMLSLLKDQKITPTTGGCYKYEEFLAATQSAFHESVILGCIDDKVTHQQKIAQIEICLSKGDFKLSCNPNSKRMLKSAVKEPKGIPSIIPCSSSKTICYYPIPH